MNELYFNFNKLRLLRKFKGYTQIEISNLIGISQSTYARLERGEIYSWEIHLSKICNILNVEKDYFTENQNKNEFDEINFYKKIIFEKNLIIKQLESEIKKLKK